MKMFLWTNKFDLESNVQAVAIFQHSFSGTVVGAIGECPVPKNPENYVLHVLS